MTRTRGHRAFLSLAAFLLAVASFFAPAHARSAEHPDARHTSFEVNPYRLNVSGQGILGTGSGRVLPHLETRAELVAHYLDHPLVVEPETEEGGTRALVTRRQQIGVAAAVGLFDRLELGMHLPLTAYQQAELPGFGLGSVATTGLGNLELYAFVTLVGGEDPPFGIAVGAPVSLPTHTSNAYLGSRAVAGAPQLRISTTLGPVRLAANGIVRLQRSLSLNNVTAGSRLAWKIGALYMPRTTWGLGAEFVGGTPLTSPFQRPDATRAEVVVGGRYRPIRSLDLRLAVGRGIVRGIGSPAVRSILSLAYHYGRPPASARRIRPACRPPAEGMAPEACPDSDFDGDGLLNRDDECPRSAEDEDGFEDGDGCPDDDNDNDGVPDAEDPCPNHPEDPDGFEDDGCPDLDNDGDGLPDVDDRCSTSPEDVDGFQDADGCPDDDNDNDGVPDVEDACPGVAGAIEENGCPKDEPPEAKVTQKQIRISERIFFHTDRAIIRPQSYDVLQKVGEALETHPNIERVEIQGYADNRGRTEYNFQLSMERAKVVRLYLIQKLGIDPDRLEIAAFGEVERETPGKTSDEEQWAEARRVEFEILERSE